MKIPEPLLDTLSQAYIGAISKNEIPYLKTRQQRLFAAVGHILGNPEEYLIDGTYLKGQLGRTLDKLTKSMDYEQSLIDISRKFGLHTPRGEKGIKLASPESLGLSPRARLSSQELETVAKLQQLINKQGNKVAYAVYARLRNQFDR